jgi:chorismate dehydratase
MRRLRISTIRYLNPAPLLWDFEHDPRVAELGAQYELDYTLPSQCADDLASGAADVGLVPIAAYATVPGLKIVAGCVIASLDHVRSIVLVVGHPDGITAVRTVAVDTSSRSSVIYTQIFFRKFLGMTPKFIPAAPDVSQMLKHADAALLIGDPALLALEHRAEIEASGGEKYQRELLWLDLAAEWRTRTGLPWVAAFWACRPELLAETFISADQLTADMNASRDAGLEHIDDLVREWTPKIALEPEAIRDYLTRNIYYNLDGPCIEAAKLFFRYAAEIGALPAAPPLNFL